jgi:hypothetical protein
VTPYRIQLRTAGHKSYLLHWDRADKYRFSADRTPAAIFRTRDVAEEVAAGVEAAGRRLGHSFTLEIVPMTGGFPINRK